MRWFPAFAIFVRMTEVTQPFARDMSCSGNMSELPALIEFVETACDDAQVRADLRFDLTLAVEEAASNVIEHGYKGKGGALAVSFELRDGVVTICLRDRARPFKPGKVNRPDTDLPLEDRPLGGLGLHLIHQLMDEVRYETLPDGNLLTMIKRDAA
jgi:anti-sigma regulatory factor (Ser/Thr protein kinase)